MNLYSFDLDGTLLAKHFGKIKQEIYDKINTFIDAGNVVIVNSGRPLEILRKYMSPIHKSENFYYSTNNGAALFKQDGTNIFCKPVLSNMLKTLQLENNNLEIFTYTLEDLLITFKEGDNSRYEAKVNEMETRVVSMDDDLSNYVMLKYVICGTKEEIDNIKIDVDRNKYSVIRTKDIMVEIMEISADKVTAIDYLCEKYKSIDKVYAFGDADNDASSIKKYFGVTFKNGSSSCKKFAKYVSNKESDEGVLDAFLSLNL